MFKTLTDVMPIEFSEYLAPQSYKYRNAYVLSEHDGRYDVWPGDHKNVMYWVKLDNGKAVGWNENPSRGWSFPCLNMK